MLLKFLKISNFFCIKQLLRYKSVFFLLFGLFFGYFFVSHQNKTPKINNVILYEPNKPHVPRPLFYDMELKSKKHLLIALLNDSDSKGYTIDLKGLLYDTQIFNYTEYQVLEYIIKNSIEKYNLFFIISKSTFFVHDQVFIKKIMIE